MSPDLLKAIVSSCQRRALQSERPILLDFTPEVLERAIVALASRIPSVSQGRARLGIKARPVHDGRSVASGDAVGPSEASQAM